MKITKYGTLLDEDGMCVMVKEKSMNYMAVILMGVTVVILGQWYSNALYVKQYLNMMIQMSRKRLSSVKKNTRIEW